MLDQRRIRSIGILIASMFLISILAPASHAQNRARLKAPKALLDAIDQEDRDCVVQSGLDKSVTVRPIMLAADHSQQLLIRGSGLCLCGAQNCGFWIYRKIGNKYELLLKGIGSNRVSAGQKSAKGYRDVISQSHASAMESILRTYRYDGSRYQLQRCRNLAYYDDNGKPTKKPVYRPCETGAAAQPNVTVPPGLFDRDVVTIANRRFKLSDYSDRTIVLNVFASWCAPCRMILPDLIELKKKYNSHPIEVLGLVSRKTDADIDEVRRFVSNYGVNFEVIWDTEDFAESIVKLASNHDVLPQTLVIDQTGQVRKILTGFKPDVTPEILRKSLDQIGAESGKAKSAP
jgi:thiol-disulfide isomerase/thioredoxin